MFLRKCVQQPRHTQLMPFYCVSVYCKCVCLVMYFSAGVDFGGITSAQRLPLPTALGGDRGAKGDVTAMSAPCMCLFAPENETPVSLQPPGHV